MIYAKNMPDIAADTLVERIRQGDQAAEGELCNRYRPGLLLIVRRRLRGRDLQDAEDLTQDTFIEVLQAVRAGKVREPEKLAEFIQGVMRNLINNFFRRNVVTCELGDEVPGRDPVELFEAADRKQKACKAIDSLNRLDREILLGVLENGESSKDIAESLGVKPDKVRQRKMRALKKLQKKFEPVSRNKKI